jgi:hypothetical protein
LLLLSQICGHWASVAGTSAKQASRSAIRMKPRRKRDRFIECVVVENVVSNLNKFIAVILFLSVVDPASAGLKEGKDAERGASLPYPGFSPVGTASSL